MSNKITKTPDVAKMTEQIEIHVCKLLFRFLKTHESGFTGLTNKAETCTCGKREKEMRYNVDP